LVYRRGMVWYRWSNKQHYTRRSRRVVFIRIRFLVSSVRCSSSETPRNGPKIGRNWVSTLWQQRRRRKREKNSGQLAEQWPEEDTLGGGRVFVVNARPTDTSSTYTRGLHYPSTTPPHTADTTLATDLSVCWSQSLNGNMYERT